MYLLRSLKAKRFADFQKEAIEEHSTCLQAEGWALNNEFVLQEEPDGNDDRVSLLVHHPRQAPPSPLRHDLRTTLQNILNNLLTVLIQTPDLSQT